MNLFRDRELSKIVMEKLRRVEAGETVDFSMEEAEFAGAVEGGNSLEDASDYRGEQEIHDVH